jgi:hypothetical protein
VFWEICKICFSKNPQVISEGGKATELMDKQWHESPQLPPQSSVRPLCFEEQHEDDFVLVLDLQQVVFSAF